MYIVFIVFAKVSILLTTVIVSSNKKRTLDPREHKQDIVEINQNRRLFLVIAVSYLSLHWPCLSLHCPPCHQFSLVVIVLSSSAFYPHWRVLYRYVYKMQMQRLIGSVPWLYVYVFRVSSPGIESMVSPVALQDHCVLCYTLQMVEQDTSLRPKMLQTPLATDHTILPCIQYTIKLKCCDAESLYTFPYCNVIIFFARAPVCEIKFSYSYFVGWRKRVGVCQKLW